MFAFIPIRTFPMGRAVLMPGDRRTTAWLLNEKGVCKGYEVIAVYALGDLQDRWMAVRPQQGI